MFTIDRTTITRRTALAGAASLAAPPLLAALPANPDVVVVDAGAASLAATKTLLDKGFNVAVIEARDRIGGRAYTESETFGVPYDHGCHWLHNACLNPWVTFAKAKKFDVYAAPDRGVTFVGNREANSNEYGEIEDTYRDTINDILDASRENRDVDAATVVNAKGPWAPLVACYIGGSSMGKDLDQISCLDYWNSATGHQDRFCTEGSRLKSGKSVFMLWQLLPWFDRGIVRQKRQSPPLWTHTSQNVPCADRRFRITLENTRTITNE